VGHSTNCGCRTYTYDGFLPATRRDAMGSLRKVVLDTAITIDYLVDGQNRRVGKMVEGVLVKGFLYQDPAQPTSRPRSVEREVVSPERA